MKYDKTKLLREYTQESWKDFCHTLPKEHIGIIYDKDDNVLMGSSMGKGKVMYRYIKPEFVVQNKPIYIGWEVAYDGIGNKDLPDDVDVRNRKEVNEYFYD